MGSQEHRSLIRASEMADLPELFVYVISGRGIAEIGDE